MTEPLFGPYRLLVPLGRGGMGEVWRAIDIRKDREVALKVLGSWLAGDPEFAKRFRREAALAARLNAPNIVPIHDYGEIDGRLFIDMPLIPGTDLAKVVAEGPLPPERAVAIVVQVARALAAAHGAGLVHRDVKPSNILVSTAADGDDHAYLIDFGITKALDATRLSMTYGRLGTPAYMAPERFIGDGDARSDIYALGCVLYEALTGNPPFAASHPFAYGYLHNNVIPPLPSVKRVGVPAALDVVVARAMAKNPDDRYPEVTELSAAARAALIRAFSPGEALRVGRRGAGPEGPARRAVTPEGFVPVVDRAAAADRTPPEPFAALDTPLQGHTDGVLAVAVTRLNGRPVAISGSRDGTIRIWDLTTATLTGRRVIRRAGSVYALAVVGLDGRPMVLAGADGGQLRMWDLTSRLSRPKHLVGHAANVQGVAVATVEGRPVAVTAGTDKTVRIWDLHTQAPVGTCLTGHRRFVFAVATAQLGGRPIAITASAEEAVRIWDLTARAPAGRPLTGHLGAVLSVTCTQLDGRPIAVTGGIDGTARVWDLAGREQLGPSFDDHDGAVRAVAVTRLDGRSVAVTGSEDGTVRLWDLDTGSAVGRPLRGHSNWITALDITELDGRPVAITGSEDSTLRVWDLMAAAEA